MKFCKKILKVIIVLVLCIYPVFANIMGGTAVIAGTLRNMYGSESVRSVLWLMTGAAMIMSSFLMIAATVSVFRDQIKKAVLSESAGLVVFLAVLAVMVIKAENSGLSDSHLVSYGNIYLARHLPAVLHPVLVYLYVFLFANDDKSRQ